jgi:hypothetical protein
LRIHSVGEDLVFQKAGDERILPVADSGSRAIAPIFLVDVEEPARNSGFVGIEIQKEFGISLIAGFLDGLDLRDVEK